MISSLIFLQPGMPLKTPWIVCWKISLALLVPKFNFLYWKSPLWVVNVVICLDSSSNSSWWYADDKSNLLKWRAPFKSWIKSSIVGWGWRSRWIAVFGWRISIHSLICSGLFGLGNATIGLTHSDGPFAGSMISSFCSRTSSLSTFLRMANGIRRVGCVKFPAQRRQFSRLLLLLLLHVNM